MAAFTTREEQIAAERAAQAAALGYVNSAHVNSVLIQGDAAHMGGIHSDGKMLREKTIPAKVTEALSYVMEAHLVIDRLMGNGQAPSESLSDMALVQSTALLSERAAGLVARLRTLFGD